MTIGRDQVKRKYLMMPNPKSIQIIRLNAKDQIVDGPKTIEYVERRSKSSSDRPNNSTGPDKTDSRQFHIWTEPLENAGWELRKGDVFVCESEWWRIDSLDLEMMDVRWRCSCSPTMAR